MLLRRDRWTPLTIVVETHEEAEILHKILATVTDETRERDGNFLSTLFLNLGKGLDAGSTYKVLGDLILKDYKEF
jgi:hypothetical protein